MIGKITKGTNFKGLIKYIIEKEKSQIIGGNVSSDTVDTVDRIAEEFDAIRSRRPDIKKPVHHVSLSVPVNERSLDQRQWEKIANAYLAKMNIDTGNHQYLIAQHSDKQHQHIHIVVNRTGLDGKLFSDQFEKYRNKDACRELEKTFNLTVVSNERKQGTTKIKQGERRYHTRTKQTGKDGKTRVNQILGSITESGKMSVQEFVVRCAEQNIVAIPNVANSTNKMNGFSFQFENKTYTGSDAGFSWKFLQEHIETLTESDIEFLRQMKNQLQQGSVFDLSRDLKSAIWSSATTETNIRKSLEKAGWKITENRISKNKKEYDLKNFCNIEHIEKEIEHIKSLSSKEKEKTREQVRELVSSYHKKSDIKVMQNLPPEMILGLLVVAPHLLFAGIALQFLANRAIHSTLPGNETELQQRIKEIYRQSNGALQDRIKTIQQEGVSNARITRSDKTDSPKPVTTRVETRREIPTRREEIPENQVGNGSEHGVFPEHSRRSIPDDDRPTGNNRSDETSHQPAAVEKSSNSLSLGNSDEFNSWNDLALSLSEVVDMKTEAVKAKERAWERQNSILNDENGFSRYRLTLVPRGENETRSAWIPGQQGDTEIFYTAEEVKEKITMLSRKNFEGYDIYVTPVNQRYVYIMIDDLKKESIEQMKADGYFPNGIWETSKDNYQALFRLERSTPQHYNDPVRTAEQEAGAEIVRELTAKYQGDTKNLGIHKAFRLAGFSNKKPERNNEFTKIVETRQDECSKTRELLRIKAEALIQEKLQTQTEERRAVIRGERAFIMDKSIKASKACIDAYLKHSRREEGLANYKGWNHDQSTLDFRTCRAMMKDGWATDSIADCLLNLSPEIIERHKNVEDYITRTVQKAEKALLQDARSAPIGETGPQFGDDR